MTKNYTHSAIYFAFAVFLGVSFGTISSAHAQNIDAATPATVPKFKNKTPKPVVEEVLEVEAEAEPKKRVIVRRRKDPIVPPRANPLAIGNEGVSRLAHLGPHQELPVENANNEASSTVDLDGVTTSSVVLDQDQPQDANISAAAGYESAANVDETALLKVEVESLKAQLLSEKKKAAKLTSDLVRAKEKTSERAEVEQASEAEVVPETKLTAEAEESDAAQADVTESKDVAVEKTDEVKVIDEVAADTVPTDTVATDAKVVADTKIEEPAKVEELKVAKPDDAKDADLKTPSVSDVVDNDAAKLTDVTKETVTAPITAETTTQATSVEENVAQTSDAEPTAVTQNSKPEAEIAKETQTAEEAKEAKEEPKVALAPTDPSAVATREVQEAPEEATNPDAANATLKEGEEVAEIDPALLLPLPRENPFPRVVPKVAKGPLYIKLPPVNDTYNMYVLGDSLGSGLWQGLHQNFRGAVAPAIKVIKKAKANTGIVRSDRFDWMENVEKIANGGGFQIAVLMFGANDTQTIRLKGKRHHFGTPAWEQIYRQRIDRMIRALKRKKIAVYWVGLPNVRVPSLRENYIHFNAIFKEKADEHGIHFVETWDVTNDASGNWQSFGKTVRGKKAVLRAKDGTHFTSAGYRLLAQFPEDVLRPDINQARANRLAKGL